MIERLLARITSPLLALALTGSCTTESSTAESASALSWVLRGAFGPADAVQNQSFGVSADLDGDTFVVGAPGEFGPPGDAGAVYVFVRSGDVWSQQAKLFASPRTTGDSFGAQVAISGDTLAVLGRSPPAVHLFTRTATTWTEQPSIDLSGLDAVATMALSGDILALGTPGREALGAATAGGGMVFVRSGGTWSLEANLLAVDPGPDDRLGSAIAIDGETIVLGAFAADVGGLQDAGAAYVFARQMGDWVQREKLVASDARRDGWFGYAVAIDGDTVLSTGLFSGAGYAFSRSSTGGWAEQARLPIPGGSSFTEIGFSADLQGDVAVMGSPNFTINGAFHAGAVWTFVRTSSTWASEGTLIGPNPQRDEGLGWRVAVSRAGDLVLATTPNEIRVQPDVRGLVRLFRRGVATGAACDMLVPCASGFCADGVCCASECGGGTSDCQACSRAAGSAVDGECLPRTQGTVCRASAGACDVEDSCDGVDTSCVDRFAAPQVECRPSVDLCDVAESCTGASADCPPDGPPMCPADAGVPDATAADAGAEDAAATADDGGVPAGDAASVDATAADAGATQMRPPTNRDPPELTSGDGCDCRTARPEASLVWSGLALAGFAWRRRKRIARSSP